MVDNQHLTLFGPLSGKQPFNRFQLHLFNNFEWSKLHRKILRSDEREVPTDIKITKL